MNLEGIIIKCIYDHSPVGCRGTYLQFTALESGRYVNYKAACGSAFVLSVEIVQLLLTSSSNELAPTGSRAEVPLKQV
jgi:hypothetical protein